MSIIKSRRSIRKYKEGAVVTKEQIHQLLEAAMHAPSAKNNRPWEFLVILNREKLDELADSHPFGKMLRKASLTIIVCGSPNVENNPMDAFFPQDCAAATQNILLQAVEIGLGSCWCGVHPSKERENEIRRILDLPESVVPFNMIAIGVPNEAPEQRGTYEEEKVRFYE